MEEMQEMANASETIVNETEQKVIYKILWIAEKCKDLEEAKNEIQKLLTK